MLSQYPQAASDIGINPDQIDDICLTAATELEFWVKTPDDKAETEELSVSQ